MNTGAYRVEWFPGVGLGIVCDDCDGEDRDLLGFDVYVTSLYVREIEMKIMEHEYAKHPERFRREH